MQRLVFDADFSSWQTVARSALAQGLSPEAVVWQPRAADQSDLDLFGTDQFSLSRDDGAIAKSQYRVPRTFVESAKLVACHRSDHRWALLYRILWRLTHDEPHLLEITIDPDTIELTQLAKAVARDMHKMRAFVRFREILNEGIPWFVAWFEPQHLIVELNSRFFVERFASMNWSILTPDRCAHWNQQELTFSSGVSRDQAPREDRMEELWRTYYGHIFNPARIKIAAMNKEMAPYYWRNLPEATLIPALLAEAPLRTERMVAESQAKSTAADVVERAPVPETSDWNTLREAAATCRACPLWRSATCTVFGEGPQPARIIIIGEQPGDQEDRTGKPFVGPAGKLLDRALAAAGVDRTGVYVTNAVKHFKWEPQGKRRLHQKPNARKVAACRPWLEKEIALLAPQLLVCLGGTAAQSILGHAVKVTEARGGTFSTEFNVPALVTVHPSALLRQPDRSRAEEDFAAFVNDLQRIRDWQSQG
jgi:probable DNA metabolism protein